jgi:hypothetical protein
MANIFQQASTKKPPSFAPALVQAKNPAAGFMVR